MISKLLLKLKKGTFRFTAIGGLRIYDEKGKIIESGKSIQDTNIYYETDVMKVSVGDTYHKNYAIRNLVITDIPQIGWYWVTERAEETIKIEFKKNIRGISRIEFVPNPDRSSSPRKDRGCTNIEIEVIDQFNEVQYKENIKPIPARNSIQRVDTPYLLGIKLIIKDNRENTYSLDSGKIVYIEEELTEEIYDNKGFSVASYLNEKYSCLNVSGKTKNIDEGALFEIKKCNEFTKKRVLEIH